jgi:hypothetical protein
MTWPEAGRLLGQLLEDPASATYAAVSGWSRPWPEQTELLAQLLDSFRWANFEKPTPTKRPWPDGPARTSQRQGNTGGRSREQVEAILRAHGHN